MHTFWISQRQVNRATCRPQRRRCRPLLEDLEGRQLLSTFKVTNNNSSGTGSLLQAISDSNDAPGSTPNVISFQIPSGKSLKITVTSALIITQPVVLNGFTQSGTTAPTPGIELIGSNVGIGLDLTASNSTVEGLAIVDFTSDGVQINSASGDLITDNYIGVTTASGNGSNGGNGVTIESSSSDNTIGGTASGAGNTISDNLGNGIDVDGSDQNVVQGNLIGTVGSGNTLNGVVINAAVDNLIGGTSSAATNVLSGNVDNGVDITGGSSDNLVEKNRIGTNASGTDSLPNGENGVLIDMSSPNNTIGGPAGGAGNTISDNEGNGIDIDDSSDNLVSKNRIGTNAGGTDYQSNSNNGVYITDGSSGNTIGATASGAYNLISGNLNYGVDIDDGSSSNVVEGNRIGTTDNGTGRLYNSKDGVYITGSSTNETSNNIIGGTGAGAGNLISGNVDNGVNIVGAGAENNVVQQNLIGTALDGTDPLPNHGSGVIVHSSAMGNTIADNTISDNEQNGVEIASGASDNLLEGNLIGTDSVGTAALPNTKDGIVIIGSTVTGAISTNNTIGGTAAGDGNTISGNGDEGVYLESLSSDTLLEGNWIGTNTGGTKALHNYADGVIITQGSSGNTIGGTATGATNTISGNWGYGVRMSSAASGTLVEGNFIGTNAAGSHALYNHLDGVYIDGSSNNTIGGTGAGAGNTISYNKWDGVQITGNAKGNLVEGDVIDSNGSGGTTADFKNGVYIDGSGAADNIIGGTAADAANTISHNVDNGVYLNNTGTGNRLEYDVIEHNGNDGVYVNLSPSTVVSYCTIEYDPGWGIWENGNDNFKQSHNTLLNDGHDNKVHT